MDIRCYTVTVVLSIQIAFIGIVQGQDYDIPPGFILPLFDEIQTPEQKEALANEAQDCWNRILYEPFPDGGSHCNITFDGWMCWNYTKAGETVYQSCPWWVVSADPTKNAHKGCFPNGTWFTFPNTTAVWTNYSACHYVPAEENVYIIYYVGYGTSVVSLIIALIIFFYFKSLGCPRVTIHKNLFVSFILCGIMWIVYFAAVVSSPSTIKEDKTWCRIILVLGQYFNTCNYFWMLSEGLYLHTVIVVAVFSENHRLHQYYIIGWVFPIVPVALYTGFMAAFNKGHLPLISEDPARIETSGPLILYISITGYFCGCWLGETPYEWWVAAFIIFVLGVNLILLLNIVRVLLTKLRTTPNAGASTYTRAVRATLILLPLLGLHYLIMPVRPPEGTLAERFFSYLIAILLSFQGFFVACIFCFFNGEVKLQIRRKWFSYRWGRKSSIFNSRYGNMNTTVTEAVSMPGRRNVAKSSGSPLLEKPPCTTMGNGKPVGTIDIHKSSPSSKNAVHGKGECYGMQGTKHFNDNKNADSQTNSPLMEHHCKSSKTTEV